MDFQEYKNNCVQKALKESNQYRATEDDAGAFLCIKRNGDEYEIRYDAVEGYICECESFQYRHFCKHLAGLQLDPEWGHQLRKPVAERMTVTIGSKVIG